MARKPTKPKCYASRGGYYVWFQGKQHLLAKGSKNEPAVKTKAQEAFHVLMLTSLEPQAGDRIPAYSVMNGYRYPGMSSGARVTCPPSPWDCSPSESQRQRLISSVQVRPLPGVFRSDCKVTLDDLFPNDVELAEAACAGQRLPRQMPGGFRMWLVTRVAATDRALSRGLFRMPRGDLQVLYEYLWERQATQPPATLELRGWAQGPSLPESFVAAGGMACFELG